MKVVVISYDKCYFRPTANRRPTRWFEARNQCLRDGGDLVSFSSTNWIEVIKSAISFEEELQRVGDPRNSMYPLGLRRVKIMSPGGVQLQCYVGLYSYIYIYIYIYIYMYIYIYILLLLSTTVKSNRHKQDEASMPQLAGSGTIPVRGEVVQ